MMTGLKSKRRNVAGFTLIEILLVISIIAVLSGLVMMALSKARGFSQRAVCVNNLKQIGIATALYSNDYNDYIPAVLDFPSNDGVIYDTLNRYMNKPDVFWCPASGPQRKWDGSGNIALIGEGVSYGFNFAGTGSNLGYQGFFTSSVNIFGLGVGRKLSGIVCPSDLIAVADSSDIAKIAGTHANEYSLLFDDPGSGNPTIYTPADLHAGGCNVLFSDGHIKWHLKNYLMENLKLWNFDNTANDYGG